MKRLFCGCLLAFGLFLTGTSQATFFIVDTGEPSDGKADFKMIGPDSALAGQFTLISAQHIGAMQGYITNWEEGHALIHVSIYADEAGLPGVLQFTRDFYTEFHEDEGWTGWQGPSGYSGYLNPGIYWLAFEQFGYDAGSMGTEFGVVPNPLSAEAFSDHTWFIPPDAPLNLSIRIEGVDVPVPEPATLALVGLGLAGLGFSRRKQ